MKKNNKNNIAHKSTTLSVKKTKPVDNKKHEEEKKIRAENLKKEKAERKSKNNKIVVTNEAKPMKKILKSMGSVKIEKLSEEDKKKLEASRKKIRKERETLYENRRIAALKRRFKNGEKTPEELKKSIEELKAEIKSQKRYDILFIFNPSLKAMVKEALTNTEIKVTLLADDYGWIKNTDSHILSKLREILPPKTSINPYKASIKVEKPKTEEKKPSNNNKDVAAAAKKTKKAEKIHKFENRKPRPRFKKPWYIAKMTLKDKMSCNKNVESIKTAA